MSKEQMISDMLYENLGTVYCYSCEYDNSEKEYMCEQCHRKNINWAISRKAADGLAKEAMRIITEE